MNKVLSNAIARVVPAIAAAAVVAMPLSEAAGRPHQQHGCGHRRRHCRTGGWRRDRRQRTSARLLSSALSALSLPPYPYAQPYPAYYPRPVYRPAYAAPFTPAPGVVCYPDRGLCFKNNGNVANEWTGRVFGY